MRRDTARLESDRFDLAIVGGGIHGAWLAWRATAAGYRVALVEQDDFAGATSANSLKILHGGLRYLQHLNLARMRSSIRSRREFARLSPHLVQPLRCVMPLQTTGVRSPWTLGPALFVNDIISADRNLGVKPEAHLPHGGLIGSRTCAEYLRPLTDARATGGAMWWDAITTDTSRLVLEPLLRAARAGAVVANRVQAQEYLLDDSSIRGLLALDRVSGRPVRIKASTVVDASGPWVGRWAANNHLPTSHLPSAWLGGVNIVLRRSLGIEAAIALSSVSLAADRSAVLRRTTRELFFVPWSGVTMVGTHYHPVPDPLGASGPPASVVESFVEEIGRVAPRAGVSMADVARVHWGLLPAGAPGDAMPRKSPVLVSGRENTGAHGLVVAVGEKFTSAPMFSAMVLHQVQRELGRHGSVLPPRREPRLLGGEVAGGAAPDPLRAEPPAPVRDRLASRYGTEWQVVARLGDERPEWMTPIHPHVPVAGVEVVHAIRNEMALTLEDVVVRRLGLGSTGHPGADVLRRCAEIAAPEFGWSTEDVERSVGDLDQRLATDHGIGAR